MNDNIASSADIMCWFIISNTSQQHTKTSIKELWTSCYTYLLLCTRLQEWDINVLQTLNDTRYRPKMTQKYIDNNIKPI